MRLLGKRDLGASARAAEGEARVLISIGPHRFTAARSEAIELARQLVAAVDELNPQPPGMA